MGDSGPLLRNESTTIDGFTYRVTQFPFKRGQRLLVRLFKLAGPAIGEAIGGVNPERPTASDIKTQAIGAALAEFAGRLTEADFDFIVSELADYTELQVETPEGGEGWVKLKQQIEFHFAGEYWRMLQWLGFGLQVNYAGFLKGRGGFAGVLAQIQTKMRSRSRKSSNGSSGESPAPSDSASA